MDREGRDVKGRENVFVEEKVYLCVSCISPLTLTLKLLSLYLVRS